MKSTATLDTLTALGGLAKATRLRRMDTGESPDRLVRGRIVGGLPASTPVRPVVLQGETIRGTIVPPQPRIPQGAVIEGDFFEEGGSVQTHVPVVIEERVLSPKPSEADSDDIEWQCNSTIALVVNALAHEATLGPRILESYLTRMFQEIGEDVVRSDIEEFIKIVATSTGEQYQKIWQDHFKTVDKPRLASLVKNVPELTKLFDYQSVQFTVRPMDMKLAFSMKGVIDAAMCATVTQMAERLEAMEAYIMRPSDESICLETVVTNAIAPLVQSQTRPAIQASRRRGQAEKKTSTQNPTGQIAPKTTTPTMALALTQSSQKSVSFAQAAWQQVTSRKTKARSASVTGTSGDYVGRKVDKCMKIQVADDYLDGPVDGSAKE